MEDWTPTVPIKSQLQDNIKHLSQQREDIVYLFSQQALFHSFSVDLFLLFLKKGLVKGT